MRKAIFAAAVAFAGTAGGGCATLAPHRPWTPATSSECPNEGLGSYASADASGSRRDIAPGDAPASDLDRIRARTCDIVRQIERLSDYYAGRMRGIANDKVRLDALTILALVTTAGFATFDGPEDNVKAGALTGAVATGLGRALNPQKRIEIYQLAYERAACLRINAAPFLRSGVDSAVRNAPDAMKALKEGIEREEPTLALLQKQRTVIDARIDGYQITSADKDFNALLQLPANDARLKVAQADWKKKTDDLAEKIRKARAALEAAQSGLGAIARAPDLLVTESNKVDVDARNGINALAVDVSKLLDLVKTDYEANLKKAGELEKVKFGGGPADPTESATPKPPPPSLEELTANVENLQLKQYADATKAIAACAQTKPETK